jgi:hypothetical protein
MRFNLNLFTLNTWSDMLPPLFLFTLCTLDKESAIITLDFNVFTETVCKDQILHLSW